MDSGDGGCSYLGRQRGSEEKKEREDDQQKHCGTEEKRREEGYEKERAHSVAFIGFQLQFTFPHDSTLSPAGIKHILSSEQI
jgi:hypothetical protein